MKGIKIIAITPAGTKAMREVMQEGTQNEAVAQKFFEERVLSEKPLTISLTYRKVIYQVALTRKQLTEIVVKGMGAKGTVPDVDFRVVWL
jgi:hypothetical protein